MKKQKLKINFDLETQKNTLSDVASKFNLEATKSFFILERGEEMAVFDTGISGKSIVNLILELAISYKPFFLHALETLKKYEEDTK